MLHIGRCVSTSETHWGYPRRFASPIRGYRKTALTLHDLEWIEGKAIGQKLHIGVTDFKICLKVNGIRANAVLWSIASPTVPFFLALTCSMPCVLLAPMFWNMYGGQKIKFSIPFHFVVKSLDERIPKLVSKFNSDAQFNSSPTQIGNQWASPSSIPDPQMPETI